MAGKISELTTGGAAQAADRFEITRNPTGTPLSRYLNTTAILTFVEGNATAFATAAQGATADSAVQPGDLATVATTGAYADLTGNPIIPSGDLADLDTVGTDEIDDDAVTLAKIATTGTPDGTKYLRDDGAWANPPGGGGGISDIVDDTTPQLGGNLDPNGFAVGGASEADLTKLSEITASAIELSYTQGGTSSFQDQLDAKAPSGHNHTGVYQPLNARLTAASSGGSEGDVPTLNASGEWVWGSGAAVTISDVAYDESSWNGVTNAAPSKNAVRDIIELLARKASPTFTDTATFDNVTVTGTFTYQGDPILAAAAPAFVGILYHDYGGTDEPAYASIGSGLSLTAGVLSATGGGTDDQTAAEVPFSPAGGIAATDVQAALEELDSEKAASSHNHALSDITSGLGTGVATFLGTPSSANLLAALTTKTGTGSAVFATSPTLVTPALGTPSAAVLTNATGLPVSGIAASTSTAIGVGSVELGHASDTTIARIAAGRASIEGAEIATLTGTQTISGKTLGGHLPVSAGDTYDIGASGTPVRAVYATSFVGGTYYGAAQIFVTENAQTGTSYQLTTDDPSKLVTMNNAAANVLTIPANATAAIPSGTTIVVQQIGAGVTTVTAASGVTFNGVLAGSGDLTTRWIGGVTLYKRATNEWTAMGAIGTVS